MDGRVLGSDQDKVDVVMANIFRAPIDRGEGTHTGVPQEKLDIE